MDNACWNCGDRTHDSRACPNESTTAIIKKSIQQFRKFSQETSGWPKKDKDINDQSVPDVRSMAGIVEVLATLEQLHVTKELLETTRLGKTVNDFRKKINNEKLAKRAKALVKKWRDAVLEPVNNSQSCRPLNGSTVSPPSDNAIMIPEAPKLSDSVPKSGCNSASSSPKQISRLSPSSSQNSNSQSPRILTNYNCALSRNGNAPSSISESLPRSLQNHSATSSPNLNSPSLRLSSPYVNKSKLLLDSTVSSSYAPSSEVTSRTSAANKRLRIEDSQELSPNSRFKVSAEFTSVFNLEPPFKKLRVTLNNPAPVNPILAGTKIDWGDSDEEEELTEVHSKLTVEDVSEATHVSVDSVSIPQATMEEVFESSHSVEVPECAATEWEAPLREVDDSEVDRLHNEQVDNLNGNTDKDGVFREWHETLTVESYKGDYLHILPYTVIDF